MASKFNCYIKPRRLGLLLLSVSRHAKNMNLTLASAANITLKPGKTMCLKGLGLLLFKLYSKSEGIYEVRPMGPSDSNTYNLWGSFAYT